MKINKKATATVGAAALAAGLLGGVIGHSSAANQERTPEACIKYIDYSEQVLDLVIEGLENPFARSRIQEELGDLALPSGMAKNQCRSYAE